MSSTGLSRLKGECWKVLKSKNAAMANWYESAIAETDVPRRYAKVNLAEFAARDVLSQAVLIDFQRGK